MARKRMKVSAEGAAVAAPRHPHSAVGGPTKAAARRDGDDVPKGTFRFWHEERRFKGDGQRCIVQQALFASGGVRTGGHPKSSPMPGPLGAQRPTDWDLLWAPARQALKALPSLQPGQLISACPGLMSLTRKRKLPQTLKKALGEALANTVLPRSFSLPDELPQWRQWLASQPGASEELWMLKTAQHLGRGLRLLPGDEALAEFVRCRQLSLAAALPAVKGALSADAQALLGPSGAAAARNGGPSIPGITKPYVLAQQYVADPLLINGCKSGIRVWLLVTGIDPLRAYLHRNGLVLFSNQEYDSTTWQGEGSDVAQGHVTNYAQNVDGTVWDLHQLEAHLGKVAFDSLWASITTACALSVASALGPMQLEHRTANVPANTTFELLGLDFLIDTSLRPWLLEVNGTPSLAVDHADPAVEHTIAVQKGGMVKDTFALLGCRDRFRTRLASLKMEARVRAQELGKPLDPRNLAAYNRRMREALIPPTDAAAAATAARELAHLGQYIPLMPHFPFVEASAVVSDPAVDATDEAAAGVSDATMHESDAAAAASGTGARPTTSSADGVADATAGASDDDGEDDADSEESDSIGGVPWGIRDLQLRAAMLGEVAGGPVLLAVVAAAAGEVAAAVGATGSTSTVV